MCLLEVLDVAMFHKQDDNVSLLEDTEHPPIKTRFQCNAHMYLKLSNLDLMGLFKVRQLFPGGRAILPSAANEPTLHGLMSVCGSIDCDHLLV